MKDKYQLLPSFSAVSAYRLLVLPKSPGACQVEVDHLPRATVPTVHRAILLMTLAKSGLESCCTT